MGERSPPIVLFEVVRSNKAIEKINISGNFMNLVPEIILADDDDGHAGLIKSNLVHSGVANEIHRDFDGQDHLDFIRREGSHQGKQPIMK